MTYTTETHCNIRYMGGVCHVGYATRDLQPHVTYASEEPLNIGDIGFVEGAEIVSPIRFASGVKFAMLRSSGSICNIILM
jgi:hypothetical protein